MIIRTSFITCIGPDHVRLHVRYEVRHLTTLTLTTLKWGKSVSDGAKYYEDAKQSQLGDC